jgi:hypothetical protein
MADLIEFTVTRGASIQVTIPQYTISGKVVDSETQETVLADFSGANAIQFPQILGQATQAQLEALLNLIVRAIITAKTGF